MNPKAERQNVYGLFNDSFPPVLDGVTLTVQNYVKWLVERREHVCVVTPWNPYDPAHPDFEMHRYFSLPIYNRHPYRYGYPRFDPFIWRKIRQIPFRLVHAHCPFSSGRLAAYAARKHNIPLIATFHSKYKTDLVRSLPPVMVDFQMRRMKEFFNNADAVWIPQAGVEETVREYGITAPVEVMPNGNDLLDIPIPDMKEYKAAARRRLGIPEGRLVLLFVGQHIKAKGVDIIIDALDILNRRYKADFEMHFVGVGYALDDMRRRVAELGLQDRVTFHGIISERAHLVDIYAAAHLFLFPSLYDNAPLVVREAGALATPAIVPEKSTSAEVIINGSNGFTCEPTPHAYAALIERIAADRDAMLTIGLQARHTLSQSWDEVMTHVFNRYEEIIERHAHSRRK